MKIASIKISKYRGIEFLELPLDPSLTVFYGENGHGKTSVLSAISVGLGAIPACLKVKSVGFAKTDRHNGSGPVRIDLTATNDISWFREETGHGFWKISEKRTQPWSDLRTWLEIFIHPDGEGGKTDLPIVAYYDTDRAVLDLPQRRRGWRNAEFHRLLALGGALSAQTDFRQFFEWFYAKENEELDLKDLSVVRQAISSMILGVSRPRIEENPLRFVVSRKRESGVEEELSLDQLSGGYRAVLALAADLARRMAQGNPHLEDPLMSEAVVLIDEVELHLHPSWQQRILIDLQRTFPNAQFIVSTHSPQVLTTVKQEHILELTVEDDRIVARAPAAATFGAEAGDVLNAVMGIDERPPENEFTKTLTRYLRLIDDGEGESDVALELRRDLEALSPYDPVLDQADVEIRRRKVFAELGKLP